MATQNNGTPAPKAQVLISATPAQGLVKCSFDFYCTPALQTAVMACVKGNFVNSVCTGKFTTKVVRASFNQHINTVKNALAGNSVNSQIKQALNGNPAAAAALLKTLQGIAAQGKVKKVAPKKAAPAAPAAPAKP